jgi:hypothetical protein
VIGKVTLSTVNGDMLTLTGFLSRLKALIPSRLGATDSGVKMNQLGYLYFNKRTSTRPMSGSCIQRDGIALAKGLSTLRGGGDILALSLHDWGRRVESIFQLYPSICLTEGKHGKPQSV